MEKFVDFLEAYFFYIWLIFAITLVSIFFFKGRKAKREFGDIDYSKARYYEKFASGFSLSAKKLGKGGASRALHILINDEEFILKTFLFVSGVAKSTDLMHRIPLKNILSTEVKRKMMQTRLHVKCETIDGEPKEFVLISSGHERIKELLDEAILKHKGFK